MSFLGCFLAWLGRRLPDYLKVQDSSPSRCNALIIINGDFFISFYVIIVHVKVSQLGPAAAGAAEGGV